MKIPLEKAFEILENASAIIINDDVVMYPSLADLEDDESNEFLNLTWEIRGLEYSLKFCEGDNKEVEVVGTSMFLYDTDANDDSDHTQITILVPESLEAKL